MTDMEQQQCSCTSRMSLRGTVHCDTHTENWEEGTVGYNCIFLPSCCI